MNVATMSMPQDVAREKLKAVRAQLHRRADAEYQELEAAYRAAAAGKPLLSMSDVFRDAPVDEKGRPKIAVARADRTQCRFTSSTGSWSFHSIDRGGNFWKVSRDGRISPDFRLRIPVARAEVATVDGFALVPIVPPDVRGNRALSSHFILWEVESWSNQQIGAQPDRDPYLLKRVSQDLFAVVAEWDLTDIERSVMAGRARS